MLHRSSFLLRFCLRALLLAAAHCCSLLLAIARCCPLLLVAASRCRDRSQGNQSIDLELRVLKIELVQEVIPRQEPSRLPRSRIQSASNARSVDRCTRLSTLKIWICIACRKAAYTAGWTTNRTLTYSRCCTVMHMHMK